MDVDRGASCLDGAHAVMVVDGVEELEMQDGADARHRFLVEAAGLSRDGVFEALRPAVGAGDDLHAVGAQRVQLADGAVELTEFGRFLELD